MWYWLCALKASLPWSLNVTHLPCVRAWCVSLFYSVFPGFLALCFEVFVDLFDEVITPVDWECKENKRKSGKCDVGPMWQVLIYPMAICISFIFHGSAYRITSKWRLWNIKQLLHHGRVVAHFSIIKIVSDVQQSKYSRGKNIVFTQMCGLILLCLCKHSRFCIINAAIRKWRKPLTIEAGQLGGYLAFGGGRLWFCATATCQKQNKHV